MWGKHCWIWQAIAAVVAILTLCGAAFAEDGQTVKKIDGLTATVSTKTPDSSSRYRLGQFYVRNAPDGQTLLIEEIIGPPPVVEIMVMSGNGGFKQVPVEVGDRIASIDATRGLTVEKLDGILNGICTSGDGSFDMTVLRKNPAYNRKIVSVGSYVNCDAKTTSADRFTKKDAPTRKVDLTTKTDPTTNAESATKKEILLTRQQVVEDIEQLYDNLVTFHPNLYRHISPKAFKRLKAKLIAGLQEKVGPLKAYATLQRLAAAVCDAHTFVTPETKVLLSSNREWPWADWQLAVSKGKLLAESGDTHFYQKHEILSINGVSGTEIAENLVAHVSYDGCIGERTLWLTGHRQSQLIFTSLFKPQIKAFDVVFEEPAPAGANPRRVVSEPFLRQFVKINIQNGQEISNYYRTIQRHAIMFPFDDAVVHDIIEYRHSPDTDVSYLYLKDFTDDVDKKIIDRVMKRVLEVNPKVLVLDLTKNPGGRIKLEKRLLAYLVPRAARLWDDAHVTDLSLKKKPKAFSFGTRDWEKQFRKEISAFRKAKKNGRNRSLPVFRSAEGVPDYKGPIIVAVGPDTHSAAGNLAYRLLELRGAKIVGTPISVDVNASCFAALGNFTLKHTQVKADIPFLCHSNRNRDSGRRGDLKLDIEIDLKTVEEARYWGLAVDKALVLAREIAGN